MSTVEIKSPTESLQKKKYIHFEPGHHPNETEKYEKVHQQFYNGYLDAHYWNPEVADRIKSYAYHEPSLVLTIDGGSPRAYRPIYSWINLPARPSSLNKKGTIYLLKGDTTEKFFPYYVLPEIKAEKMPSDIIDDAEKRGEYERELVVSTKYRNVKNEGELIGLGIGAGILAIMLGKGEKSSKAKIKQLTRRQFIVGAGKTAVAIEAALHAGSKIPYLIDQFANAAAVQTTEDSMKFWQNLNNLLGPKSTVNVDGRTALLIAKTSDHQQLSDPAYKDAIYSILMGTTHDAMSGSFRDKSARAEIIKLLAQQYVDTGKQIWARYYNVRTEDVPNTAINNILNYICEYEIEQIVDPGGHSPQQGFDRKVDHYIKSVGNYYSQEVMEAVKDLRPK